MRCTVPLLNPRLNQSPRPVRPRPELTELLSATLLPAGRWASWSEWACLASFLSGNDLEIVLYPTIWTFGDDSAGPTAWSILRLVACKSNRPGPVDIDANVPAATRAKRPAPSPQCVRLGDDLTGDRELLVTPGCGRTGTKCTCTFQPLPCPLMLPGDGCRIHSNRNV